MGAVRWGSPFLASSPAQIGSPSCVVCDQQVGIPGNFQLLAQPLGFYKLRVVGAAGEIRHSQDLHNSTGGELAIVLGDKKQPVNSGLISAARLEHKTTKRAKKEVGEAMKAFRKGKRLEAIRSVSMTLRIWARSICK